MNIPDTVTAFHGHVCPGIAYGYRVSLVVLRKLGERAHDEELIAIVENDSCAVDAIQVMTGCTFGKGNLIFKDYGKQVYTFIKRSSNEGVRIAVKNFTFGETHEQKQVWKRFMKGERSEEVQGLINEFKASKINRIVDADEEELFKIENVQTEPPHKAKIYPSLICSLCGEKMMEARARIKEGNTVCIPCFLKNPVDIP
jgi:formylmethanofuran dehydrogenase subunit E